MPDTFVDSEYTPSLRPNGHVLNRVWQACQPCRRRKVKCDGKQPCHNCASRSQTCAFPDVKDHASVSRYYALSLEARCQQMDATCQRLEAITAQIMHAVNVIGNYNLPLEPNTNLGNSVAEATRAGLGVSDSVNPSPSQPVVEDEPQDVFDSLGRTDVDTSDSAESDDDPDPDGSDGEGVADQATAFVKDSYGRFRFVGGTANKMLFDAAKGVSSSNSQTQPSQTPGSGTLAEISSAQGGQVLPEDNDVELPLFVRGKVWPELPFLPRPEQLPRPPQYISDLLVGLYFDKLHYTFPVLFKPHFMRSYGKMLRCGPNTSSPALDKDFLKVFFAVCACASGLLPASRDGGFPGFEYYEKALLLHYASPGQASLERVQCLGLLAVCTASWNTLTQSWSLAGMAVRSSMDIGLHVNSRFTMPPTEHSGDGERARDLQSQIKRRTWWSVLCLERTVSLCLGRPTAVDENDCCCELPLDISDEHLERQCQPESNVSGQPMHMQEQAKPALTGFLAFARLCQISVRVQKLGSPMRLRQLSSSTQKRTKTYMSRVSSLDQSLNRWLETLPDSVRFSANAIERRSEDSGLVMCVIVFIMHAGSLLSLYRYVAQNIKRISITGVEGETAKATAQCLSAARSCINAAELVRDLVPPSHYLAICVHCLTLSGVSLLSMSKHPPDEQTTADVEKCIALLKDLELRWSGASRSRAVIENLVIECSKQENGDRPWNETADNVGDDWVGGLKRSFATFDNNMDGSFQDSLWRNVLWTDLLDGSQTAGNGLHGTYNPHVN